MADIKKYVLLYLKSGVIVVAEEVSKNATTIKLKMPCILNLQYNQREVDTKFYILVMIDPILTDEEVFTMKCSELLFQPITPNKKVIDIYEEYIGDNQ